MELQGDELPFATDPRKCEHANTAELGDQRECHDCGSVLEAPVAEVTVTGRTPWHGFIRYDLSNGWFIDGATMSYRRVMGYKYALFEPGGDPSGCAAFRGGAPTLKLAVAVANGAVLCGREEHGCRKTAVAFHVVTVGGIEGYVFRCEDHRTDEDQPLVSGTDTRRGLK